MIKKKKNQKNKIFSEGNPPSLTFKKLINKFKTAVARIRLDQGLKRPQRNYFVARPLELSTLLLI